MSGTDLGVPERAALLALMAVGREISNPELARITGFALTGRARRRLNDLKLVNSWQEGRAYAHELTDKGWRWCADELIADCPPKAGSFGGALYAVLAGLHGFFARSGLRLADVFGPGGAQSAAAAVSAPPPAVAPALDLEERIRVAYWKLTKEPRDWVSLTQLRPLLGDAPRDEVDATLRRMSRTPQVNIVPQEDQKTLSAADRESAVRIGNEDTHLISIEES